MIFLIYVHLFIKVLIKIIVKIYGLHCDILIYVYNVL